MHNFNMRYLLSCIVFFVFSCLQSRKDLTNSKEPNVSRGIEIVNDTVTIKGRTVLFFSISQLEYDQISKDTNSGIEEVLNDFNYYAEEVSDTIRKQGFTPIETASRYIKVVLDDNSFKIFDRLSNEKNMTGFIITNGKEEPSMEFGVAIDDEVKSALNDFNKK